MKSEVLILTCPYCSANLEVPSRGQRQVACVCGRNYELAGDYGWWDYSIEVYEEVKS